ncbi:tyrosine-type recombinase/integrase [Serratia marcescens]|uniref:tyrosine-type recombinase/integrase n=1 Tax=Serratia marcescens TaxID=615 RepID=UPI0034E1CDE6
MRKRELAATAKVFMLDQPHATAEELKAHLLDMAEGLLTEPTDDYWNGPIVAHLHDAMTDLRTIAATHRISAVQQAPIVEALVVVAAGMRRVDHGDATGLLEAITECEPKVTPLKEEGDIHHHNPPTLSEPKAQGVTFKELADELVAERKVSIKPSTLKSLASSLGVTARLLPEGMDIMSRQAWLGVRDSMLAAYAPLTVNKLLTNAKTVFEYALMNGRVTGRNPLVKLKVANAKSTRRAFTEEELVVVAEAVSKAATEEQRFAGGVALVTGARAAEVATLTPEDVLEVDGMLCISINEDGDHKSLKNSYSKRLVPLVSGYGFNATAFAEWAKGRPAGVSMFNMTGDTMSKWFNARLLPKARLPSVSCELASSGIKDVCLHSLRHSVGTALRQAGVPLADAQAILGHSSQSITYDLYGAAAADTSAMLRRLRGALLLAIGGAVA